jgi:hypothetical protein
VRCQYILNDAIFRYSPGVCPSGWNIAQSRVLRSKTQAWCCPQQMIIYGTQSGLSNYQFCTSLISADTVLSLENGLYKTVDLSSTFIGYQWPLSVEWASSDLSLFTPASAPRLAATQSSGILDLGSMAPVGTMTPSQSSAVDHGSLSTGAKAGIGVGVAVAGAMIIGALVLWFLRRRVMRKRIPDLAANNAHPYVDGKVELPHDGAEIRAPGIPVELGAMNQSPREVDGETKANELSGKRQMSPVELEGNWYGHEADVRAAG